MTSIDELALATVQDLLQQDPASQMLAIEIVAAKQGYCQLKMRVRPDMTNGYGLCHGGFIFTLADTAVAFACAEPTILAVSATSQIDFLAAAHLNDEIFAKATMLKQVGRQCFCDVEVVNGQGETIALLRARQVRLAQKNAELK